MNRSLAILFLVPLLAGCPVIQPQDTPVSARKLRELDTGRKYWLYVPSNYSTDRDWPLVVTLHGSHGWDNSRSQIMEWKHLAEEKGFIVVAPDLKCTQGILPVIRSLWLADLESDERAILEILDELTVEYKIDPKTVLLTGFSAGGYPLFYVGLRHPDKFHMLIARGANSDLELLESIEVTDRARELPIVIFWGKDEILKIQKDSWQAYRFLRERRFFNTRRKEIRGGHLRRPEMAYRFWSEQLPERHRPMN